MSEDLNMSIQPESLTDSDLPVLAEPTDLISVSQPDLNQESLDLLAKIISEPDESKADSLMHLFNVNQNKKTLVRVNKLSDLLDTITDQALTRFTKRPDEISNKELFDGLKIVQDLIERGQKQASGANLEMSSPLIQINQQTNEVNMGDSNNNLSRESREKVKSAVLGILQSITASTESVENVENAEDYVEVDYTSENEDNNGE
jgi:hypothetical protein